MLGGILIYLINLFGSNFDFYIGLNIFTSIFVRNTWHSRRYLTNTI
ncbi:MAG: pro-sigmaK processing inhibitor BofA family protein [Oscillospiraceae bacterium]|nr:pro-sigmaK processing inhibitor BofA family protein [Oscillospiraceae bacterium]